MSGPCLGLRRAGVLLSLGAAALLLLLLPRGPRPAAPRPPRPAGPSAAPPHRAGPAGSAAAPGGGPGAGGLAGSSQLARRGRLGTAGSAARESLELKDIFIAVKTTRKYHRSRLDLLLQTWISQARGQVSDFASGQGQPAAPALRFQDSECAPTEFFSLMLKKTFFVRLWKVVLYKRLV